jgi:putative RecB family exonuclease
VTAPIYSHSRLSSFEDCPKKFQYRYVLRVPTDTESIEGFVGKRVHEVLERLYRFTENGQVPSLARVLERFRIWWGEHYDPARVRIVRRENDADHYRALGERCLSNYYRRFYPFDGDETLALEERVAFSLDESGNYRLQGFIDRVVRARDGAIEVHDYKTSQRVPSQEILDRDRQLALYQMGLADRFGSEQPMRLVWHYLLLDKTRTSTRTPEQLEALRGATIGLIDRIRTETHFEPRPSALCRWCEFSHLCPAGGASREGEPPHPAEGPQSPAPAPGRRQLPLL